MLASVQIICSTRTLRKKTTVTTSLIKNMKVKIGIIGGSGFDNTDFLEKRHEKSCSTPFGQPSDSLICGKISGVDCVLLGRHGRTHTIMPSLVNYRANVWAMKEEDCTHLIVTSACGSLREHIPPGDFVILDQFIDRTQKRCQTFYDGTCPEAKGLCHIPLDKPFCPLTSKILYETVKELGFNCQPTGTTVTIEGPRFSSKAESKLWRQWGADTVNMTTVPEVILAKEVGLCYATLAMATDYDSWHESEEPVSVEQALKTLKSNGSKATDILRAVVPKIATHDWTDVVNENQAIAQASVMAV